MTTRTVHHNDVHHNDVHKNDVHKNDPKEPSTTIMPTPTNNSTNSDSENRALLRRAIVASAIEFPLFGLLLFGAAGTITWVAAWVWLGILAALSILMIGFLLKHNPGLLKERMRSPIQTDQKGWDKVLLSVFIVLFLLWLPLMGLDAVRFHWSHWPEWCAVLGAILLIASDLFISWCFVVNSYLAPVVKIQTERGHSVVSTGPYAIVRHPMYAGALVFFVGTALLLRSSYGLVDGLIMCVILVIRTALEDRMLQAELSGYSDYATKVRFRLLPGVW